MAKATHMMIRVLDEARSVDYYSKAFGLAVAERVDFPEFTLIYLANDTVTFELELTVNKGRKEPYELGSGYGHLAFVVDDVEAAHKRVAGLGLPVRDIKDMMHNGQHFARYFFADDPDGYKIEVVQRAGRFR